MTENFAARDAWTAATELLRSAGKLSDSQTAFVRMARPLAAVDEVFVIGVGSDFVKEWIIQHVSAAMTEQLSAILGREVKLMISVDPSLSEQQAPTTSNPAHPNWTPNQVDERHVPESEHFTHSDYQQMSEFSHQEFSHQEYAHQDYPVSDYVSDFQQPDYSNHEDYSSHQNSHAHTTSYVDHRPEYQSRLAKNLPHIPNSNSVQTQARLNPRYTFETFVTGESNRFAHATALAVSEAPGSTYNPLFLYSDSGMGKTHLLHAIGNYTVKLYPQKKVLYISSEEFTNAFINALRDQKIHAFKDQFRNVDILLIDDIQFISNRDSTLEEFFHTFNALSNANKQIVITSDVAPKLLTGFEDRMISRFASGITASIDLPNLETRIAILEKKATAEQLHVPRPVLEFIASKMTTNVREMEGALRRITAYADLAHNPITLDMAELVLKDMISDPESVQITAGLVMAQTAAYFDISLDELKSQTRTRSLTTPRHIAMYLCREMTDLSLPKIAESFDRRDHTTVLNALRKIEKLMAEKQHIFNQVSELTARVKQSAKEQAQHRKD
ncbi:chromosomal replication initiator protein [Arcanobacterium pluranimalium]|uniref:chromosomal replication initiator protein DnaA n=1 Tax=Arcanobacterium pluranimalium TaxID=108028 RepID=UPI00195D579D|nr:chromosomal replication initiator protein DnaA [Arcanobacterium pluranimalium]MBM7824441.1 chromosomal replication initiator protein [Arcanobacterium pluranimalium]